MPRTAATYQAAMQEVSPKPTTMLEIATGLTAAGSEFVRVTSDDADRMWPDAGGKTFTARPFETSEFIVSGEDRPGLSFTFSDTDGFWNTLLESTTFRWKKAKRYVIDRDVTGSSAQAMLDTFRVISFERGDRSVTLHTEPYMAFLTRIRVPARTMTRENFPGIPNEPYGS